MAPRLRRDRQLACGAVASPAVETIALRKSYGSHPALEGIDLTVRRGEVFGLIGPNGAGKTTVMRILLDLIRASSGSARVLGFDSRRDTVEVRRRIGYLPGQLALYEDLNAAQHLRLLASLRGRRDLDPRPLAERLDLDLKRPIRALSKGNRQKVGLVQAFMHEPEVLILDEPTSGLDPLIQHEFSLMLEEARGRGQTVMLSSHVLSEVERLADRIGLIRAGKVALVDDIGELRARADPVARSLPASAPPPDAFEEVAGVSREIEGERVTLVLDGSADAVGQGGGSLRSAGPDQSRARPRGHLPAALFRRRG